MGDFFYSWRRKVGCITLVMATMLMAPWLRSMGAWPAGEGYEFRVQFVESMVKVDVDHLSGISNDGYASEPLFTVSAPYWSVVIPITILWLPDSLAGKATGKTVAKRGHPHHQRLRVKLTAFGQHHQMRQSVFGDWCAARQCGGPLQRLVRIMSPRWSAGASQHGC